MEAIADDYVGAGNALGRLRLSNVLSHATTKEPPPLGGQAPSNAEILKADRDRHGTPATVYGFSNLNSKPGRLGARGLALHVFRLAGWRARQVLPLLSAGPKLESFKHPSIGPRYLHLKSSP